ncbi:MAG TPA: hypothetical protein PKK92_03635, partial [Methanothrix sp.]|nr:hypothetical protein [Methanothrix sp.]
TWPATMPDAQSAITPAAKRLVNVATTSPANTGTGRFRRAARRHRRKVDEDLLKEFVDERR